MLDHADSLREDSLLLTALQRLSELVRNLFVFFVCVCVFMCLCVQSENCRVCVIIVSELTPDFFFKETEMSAILPVYFPPYSKGVCVYVCGGHFGQNLAVTTL